MKGVLEGKIGDGWQGYIVDGDNVIDFGCYINSKGVLVLPTFHYVKGGKVRKSLPHLVKAEILKLKPSESMKDFVLTGLHRNRGF